jgi:hypothetical protein
MTQEFDKFAEFPRAMHLLQEIRLQFYYYRYSTHQPNNEKDPI